MPKTAEQILKAQGLTDAEIAAYATLLADPRQRAAIENPFNKLEGDLEQFAQRNREWEEYDVTAKSTLASAEQDAIKARREAADLREQIKIAREYGYLGAEAEEKARQVIEEKQRQEAASAPRGFNPDDPKFKEFAGNFSRAEGDSIAVHNYVAEEYRRLDGGSINDYVSADGRLRGMPALRAESQAAGKPINQYAEEKFGWQAKRSEMEAKRKADYEEKLRKEGEQRYALAHGTNPMTNTPMPSRNPFVATTSREGKQPWELQNPRGDRLRRALENEVKSQHVN